jgi:hypothetical protein
MAAIGGATSATLSDIDAAGAREGKKLIGASHRDVTLEKL